MKKIYIRHATLLLAALLISKISFSQLTSIQWQKCLGGTADDFGYSVTSTSDGGSIVAGHSGSDDGDLTLNNGSNDYCIFKLNAAGIIQWQKTLGGSSQDQAYEIIQTADGGFLIAGNTSSNDSDVVGNHSAGQDFWIVRLDNIGNLLWKKCFGGTLNETAYSIIETNTGAIMIAGSASSNDGDVTNQKGNGDFWVIKLNPSGILLWARTYGGTSFDQATRIIKTSDNNYVIVGLSFSDDGNVLSHHGLTTSSDYWMIKINGGSGNPIWQKTFGGTNYDNPTDVKETNDHGFIIAGASLSNDGDVTGHHGTEWDYWIVKTDSAGNLQWQKSLGGSKSESARAVQVTANGEYIIAGSANSTNGDVTGHHGTDATPDYWLVKLNAAGNLVYNESFGGSDYDLALSMDINATNDIIIAGYTSSTDGQVTGLHNSATADCWVLKLSSTLGIDKTSENNSSLSVSPNPFTETAIINFNDNLFNSGSVEYKIHDVFGKTLRESVITPFNNQISREGLKNGVYFLRISNDNKEFSTTKLLVQ